MVRDRLAELRQKQSELVSVVLLPILLVRKRMEVSFNSNLISEPRGNS